MHDNRTPLPPCRSVVAKDLDTGDLIAGHTPNGSYPFRVLTITPLVDTVTLTLEEIGHASGLTDQTHTTVEATYNRLDPVITLPVHYGLCHDCGKLSPCPDELSERRLEKLWSTVAHQTIPQ